MIYLFHGEDIIAAEESLAQLLDETVPPEMHDLAVTRLEGGGLTAGTLIEHCAALPLLAPQRVVIVEGLAGRLEKGQAEQGLLAQLQEYLPRMAETTVLVLRERQSLPARHPLLNLVKKVGQVREFAPPRGRELARWVTLQARRQEVEITPAAADLLAATVGTTPAVLRQEIDKMATYVGPQGRIDERLVAELSSAGRLSDIFALVDALGQRRRGQAMVELRRLFEAGQHPLYVLAMIVRQFRLLLQVKALPAGGRTPAAVACACKVHPFVAEKIVAQAQVYGREDLEQIYHRLLETDREIKTGQHEGEVALEMTVVEVAGR